MNPWLKPILGDTQDERLLHRLEAFSDIVIGFCMAELTFSLGTSNGDLVAPVLALPKLYPFVLGFFTIAIMWWFHNRLFAKFFIINTVMIVANFATLGSLMLMIYFIQAFSIVVTLPNPTDSQIFSAARLYFATGSLVYGLLGLMFALGIVSRWSQLDLADRRFGVRRAFASFMATAVFVTLSVMFNSHAHIKPILVAVAILAVAVAISRRIVTRLVRD